MGAGSARNQHSRLLDNHAGRVFVSLRLLGIQHRQGAYVLADGHMQVLLFLTVVHTHVVSLPSPSVGK